MAKCAHFEVCGIEADTIPEGGHCILHAENPDKDQDAFAEALETHLATGTGDFRHIHFCGTADFARCTFEAANFHGATFEKWADFLGATFKESVSFTRATFNEVSFIDATFNKEANFRGATFNKRANFSHCTFRGSALFEGSNQRALVVGAEIDLRSVTLDPLDAVAFRNADLRRCRFLNTDVREIEFTSVEWCRKPPMWWPLCRKPPTWLGDGKLPTWLGGKGTVCVYDELCYEDPEKPWGRLERLYRELKQNYEDRRDYGRAGDFHFREKQIRKCNPNTSPGHKLLLWLYWGVSGYGERIWPAVAWLVAIVFGCAALYLAAGIAPAGYGSALLYSAQTSFLIRPGGYVLTEIAQWVRLVQIVVSPILLGLIALAIRQRLKR